MWLVFTLTRCISDYSTLPVRHVKMGTSCFDFCLYLFCLFIWNIKLWKLIWMHGFFYGLYHCHTLMRNMCFASMLRFKTRRSQNDTTPQPLNQWMGNPFMSQQVGKVLQFHIDPLLGQCICHAMWATSKPVVRPPLYPTHTSFIPSHVDVNYSIVRFCVIHFEAISQPAPKLLNSTMGLNIKNHNLSPTPYRVTSFWLHDNPPSDSYDRTFFNLTFKIQG